MNTHEIERTPSTSIRKINEYWKERMAKVELICIAMNGAERCKNNVVYGSQLCRKHGGTVERGATPPLTLEAMKLQRAREIVAAKMRRQTHAVAKNSDDAKKSADFERLKKHLEKEQKILKKLNDKNSDRTPTDDELKTINFHEAEIKRIKTILYGDLISALQK